MAFQPDLTLPAQAPPVESSQEHSDLLPAALYTLIEFTDDELEEVRRACERETIFRQSGDNIRLSLRANFANENLRVVYDYHLQLRAQSLFDPVYFLVVFHRDWESRGVLLVALDDDDLQCKVDKACGFAGTVGLEIKNLQIANVSWDEVKEASLPFPGEGGDDDSDDDNGDQRDDRSAEYDNDESTDDDSTVPTKPALGIGKYCGVYVVEGANEHEVVCGLQPSGHRYRHDPEALKEWPRINWPVQFLGYLRSPSTHLSEALSKHTSRCRRNKWLDKEFFFLADSVDPHENGVLLCQVSERRAQRLELRDTIAFQQTYLRITRGERPWTMDLPPLVLAFADHYSKDRLALEKHGGSFYMPLNYSPEDRKQLPYDSPEAAIQDFPLYVRQMRFNTNLVKDHLICITKDWKEKGVLVIHVQWDGNAWRSESEMRSVDLTGRWKGFRCPANEAYLTLRNIIDREQPWPASEEVDIHADEWNSREPTARDLLDGKRPWKIQQERDIIDSRWDSAVPDHNHPSGIYCGVYTVEGADADHVMLTLQPDGMNSIRNRESAQISPLVNWGIQYQGAVSNPNPVDRATALHSHRCGRNGWLDKDYFLLADTTNPDEDGLLLCQISERRTQRLPLTSLTYQKTYLNITRNKDPWSTSDSPTFLVYRHARVTQAPEIACPEPGTWIYKSGISTPAGPAQAVDSAAFKLPGHVLRQFLQHVRQHRFNSRLVKTCFVYAPEDWDRNGTYIIHVDWDEIVARSDKELEALIPDVRRMCSGFRCPSNAVYRTLTQLMEGGSRTAALRENKIEVDDDFGGPIGKGEVFKYRTKLSREILCPGGAEIGQKTWWTEIRDKNAGADEPLIEREDIIEERLI